MDKVDNYLVIGFGRNKKGNNYSRLAKIIEFNKDGNKGGFVDLNQSIYSDEIMPIGSVKEVMNVIN